MEIDYLRNNVDWNACSMAVCAVAHNGLRGLDLFDRIHPDLVITDIEMPGLDGIEMSRRIRERDEKVRIVFLSSYSVFEYAKSGFDLGVSEYILKQDIGTDKVTVQLVRVREELKRSSEYESGNMRRSLNALFDNRPTGFSVAEMDKIMGIAVLFHDRFVPVVETEMNEKSRETGWWSPEAEPAVEGYVLLERSHDRSILLWESGGMEPAAQIVSIQQIVRRLKKHPSCVLRVLFLDPAVPVRNLAAVYRAAEPLFTFRFFMEEYEIVQIKDIKRAGYTDDTQTTEKPAEGLRELEEDLREKNQDRVEAWFSGVFRRLIVNRSGTKIEHMLRSLFVLYGRYAHEHTGPEVQLSAEELAFCTTWQGTVSVMKSRFLNLTAVRKDTGEAAYAPAVSAAVRYMRIQYSVKTLSIDDVAAAAGLSPSRFRAVFRMETDRTPKDFLSELRMDNAEQLLKTTVLRINEIAERVGYLDGRYFRKVFKQKHNKTPAEYRRTNAEL